MVVKLCNPLFQIGCQGADTPRKLCGKFRPELMTFNCSMVELVFDSDEVVNFAGFRLRYNILYTPLTGLSNLTSWWVSLLCVFLIRCVTGLIWRHYKFFTCSLVTNVVAQQSTVCMLHASANIAIAEVSIRMSVRLTHSSIASKRTKLGSFFLHRRSARHVHPEIWKSRAKRRR